MTNTTEKHNIVGSAGCPHDKRTNIKTPGLAPGLTMTIYWNDGKETVVNG